MKSKNKSIKKQMVTVFISLIVLILGLIFIVNNNFLEHYYTSKKTIEMQEMYETIEHALEEGTLDDDDVQENIWRKIQRNNIFVFVMNDKHEMVLETVQEEYGSMYIQLMGYIFGKNTGEPVVQTDQYNIYKAERPDNTGGYLEMYGVIAQDYIFLMQSPLASIQDSAQLANRFLVYVGCVALLLGAVFVWFFSKRIADPILELVELSQRMANLDFDAKYTGGGCDEISILGENFNSMSKKLEETISELKRANNQLQKDIEQKEKIETMRNEFLGNVSHELKTPLALIQGYAEGLKEGISEDPESREFYCDVIMDEADKMNTMVKNLLALNQLEFGNDEMDFQRFDLVKMIRGVLASCEILLQQASASVDFIADDEVCVWGDQFKTEQVVRNYLTNAIHHVDFEKRIEICVIRQVDTVRVTIFNSGKPIPEEDLERLWDKFYKVDKAHTREYGGNGIGLSIVKAIMESFHQKYGVRNFENGVEFWFELDSSETCVKNCENHAETDSIEKGEEEHVRN